MTTENSFEFLASYLVQQVLNGSDAIQKTHHGRFGEFGLHTGLEYFFNDQGHGQHHGGSVLPEQRHQHIGRRCLVDVMGCTAIHGAQDQSQCTLVRVSQWQDRNGNIVIGNRVQGAAGIGIPNQVVMC